MNTMKPKITNAAIDQLPVYQMENDLLQVVISPETGGRIINLYHKRLQREFLWRNERLSLTRLPAGSPYDPNFYGGFDELLPCDMPETIGGTACPDHGELWTLSLESSVQDDSLILRGRLPLWDLQYEKRVSLHPDAPSLQMDYRIENVSRERRVFLWKLHAAATIRPGDQVICPAQKALVADPEWSRWKTTEPFDWPVVNAQRADIIPPPDGTTDFLYLYDLADGDMRIRQPATNSELAITFDRQVFPYAWYFASYGGFDGHFTAVLEPCTSMPISVNEATQLGQCSQLEPGAVLETQVVVYAGPAR